MYQRPQSRWLRLLNRRLISRLLGNRPEEMRKILSEIIRYVKRKSDLFKELVILYSLKMFRFRSTHFNFFSQWSLQWCYSSGIDIRRCRHNASCLHQIMKMFSFTFYLIFVLFLFIISEKGKRCILEITFIGKVLQ